MSRLGNCAIVTCCTSIFLAYGITAVVVMLKIYHNISAQERLNTAIVFTIKTKTNINTKSAGESAGSRPNFTRFEKTAKGTFLVNHGPADEPMHRYIQLTKVVMPSHNCLYIFYWKPRLRVGPSLYLMPTA